MMVWIRFFFIEFDTKHCLHLFVVESSNEREKYIYYYLLITSFDGPYIKIYFNLPTFKTINC
jgi:hypothetical protein